MDEELKDFHAELIILLRKHGLRELYAGESYNEPCIYADIDYKELYLGRVVFA